MVWDGERRGYYGFLSRSGGSPSPPSGLAPVAAFLSGFNTARRRYLHISSRPNRLMALVRITGVSGWPRSSNALAISCHAITRSHQNQIWWIIPALQSADHMRASFATSETSDHQRLAMQGQHPLSPPSTSGRAWHLSYRPWSSPPHTAPTLACNPSWTP